jgi:RNA polymerase-binding transcription factor DksA
MDTIKTGRHRDELNKRREHVFMTLRYLEKERKIVEENTDWLDRAAYESRITLLDQLNEYYITEINEIDRALERVNKNTYGLCLACHNAIQAPRLELFPAAAFCAACQETREGLQRV